MVKKNKINQHSIKKNKNKVLNNDQKNTENKNINQNVILPDENQDAIISNTNQDANLNHNINQDAILSNTNQDANLNHDINQDLNQDLNNDLSINQNINVNLNQDKIVDQDISFFHNNENNINNLYDLNDEKNIIDNQEVLSEQIINDDYDYDDEESIRSADEVFCDQLIDDNFNNSYDNELNLAIQESLQYQVYELEDVLEESKKIFDEYNINYIKEESIKLEEERLKNNEKKNRFDSLSNFSNVIKRLIYTNEEIEVKEIIQNILHDYFELKIDSFKLDKEKYDKIFKIIDTYYIIPINKKYKKTLITKFENDIIRSIFIL